MIHSKDIFVDWVKNTTMFSVARWLSGESLMDRQWQMSTLFTLLGFSVYQLSTRNIIDTDYAGSYKAIADDWLKFGTMFIVSRLLSGQSLFDMTWVMSTLATLIGFSVYHLVLKLYVKGPELSSNKHIIDAIDDTAKWGTMFLVARMITGESILDHQWALSSLGTIIGFITYDVLVSPVTDKLPISNPIK